VSLGIHQTEPDWLRVTLVGPNRKNVMEGDVVGDRTLTAVLPADGTYTFLFSADAGLVSLHPTRPLDLTLTLSEYVRASIAIDDPSVSLTTRAGQLAAVSFTGKVDQHVSLGIQQKVPDWLRVTLVGPDGKNVMEADVVGDRALTAVLPAEGTYTFLFSADAGLASLHAARPLDLTLTLSSSP